MNDLEVSAYLRGVNCGHKIFRRNSTKYKNYGLHESSRALHTCKKYAFNKKVKQTRKGDYLTKSDRAFYKGVADGLELSCRRYF